MIDLLYGRRPVYETLQAGRRHVHRLTLAEGIQEHGGIVGQIVAMAGASDIPVTRSLRSELDRVTSNHQGIVAATSAYPYVELDDILTNIARTALPLLLLLDLVQDPQNAGSLLRTAEAIGVQGVILPQRRAVGITPAVVAASAGAVEHLQVALVTNLARTIDQLKRHELWIAGMEAIDDAQLFDQADLCLPLGLVVGSEGSGLRRLVREKCDLLLRLPMRGRVASLNASVAGSVALYEVDRQRRSGESASPKH